ncbi:MAG: ABC transporter permease [Alphaproteobacteria bacterium]|nr:ABC transporter permease [Alphaproteobacteria bacterium]
MRKKTENEPLLTLDKDHLLSVVFEGDITHFNSEDFLRRFRETAPAARLIELTDNGIQEWDSSLVAVLYEIIRYAQENKIKCSYKSLPKNLRDLIRLAFADDRKPTHGGTDYSFLESIGKATIDLCKTVNSVLSFLGQTLASVGRFFSGRSVMRGVDFCSALEDCGPKAIAIVALISFLVGLILAFVGAIQLQTFGAQIYVASLVTIGMCRIMGAIMVGIIMAGRTGSSYAATIGTMQVNEELDALQTMGMSRVDFLVLPRIFALILAMPILTMLADIMGMIGGAAVGVFMLDLPYEEYLDYSLRAFTLKNFLVGIFHGFCFGIIIALCGCYSGLTCGRNADSVGVATTHSVVNAIVWMIVVTGIITVVCLELGI